MLTPRYPLLVLGLASLAGCAPSHGRSGPAPSTQTATEIALPAPSAAPLATSTLATPTPAAPAFADLVIPNEGTGQALGLTIQVLSIVEKRLMDGSGMMRVGVRVSDGSTKEDLQFESPGNEVRTFGRYKLTYRGGWRSEVQLLIESVSPAPGP